MSRIAKRFAELHARGRKALIPFITAGDPSPEHTVPLMHAMVANGADAIELGIPFSDPMADGPVIQRSSERALKHHVSVRDVLGMVREFRQRDTETPIVFMGYLNPYEIMGYEPFARAAAEAGVDGVLTVDLPPEEADEFVSSLKAHSLDPIFLIAPTTAVERIGAIDAHGSGFIYYVSFKGVTGANKLDVEGVRAKLDAVRAHTRLPVIVGFGIKDAESAAAVARVSEGVVVGSALVARMESVAGTPERLVPEVSSLVAELRRGLDAA